MNHKITRMSCGVAVASLAVLALVACDNETLSGPNFNSTNSSIAESSSSVVESSSAVESSSSEILVRPRCDALDPECGYTVEELCRMGETRFCKSSSSSLVEQSSSSVIALSSSSNELCKHVTDVECEACPPGEKCICHPCDSKKETESRDCRTFVDLKCIDGEWRTPDEFCPNGRWTTVCGDKWLQNPVCCKQKETCRHISDYDGMTEQGNCVNQNGSSAVDCVTGDNYQCRNNYWEKVSCLNIKPDECKPGMGGCGYRLCEPNGIKEIAVFKC